MCEVAVLFYFFSEAVLMRIMHILATAAAKAHTQDTCATFIKFSSPEAMHVSRHPCLKNASGLLGMCTLHLLPKTWLCPHVCWVSHVFAWFALIMISFKNDTQDGCHLCKTWGEKNKWGRGEIIPNPVQQKILCTHYVCLSSSSGTPVLWSYLAGSLENIWIVLLCPCLVIPDEDVYEFICKVLMSE